MHADIAQLGIALPTAEPRATEHMPAMLQMIGRLEARGLAYRTPYDDPYYGGAVCCLLCHEELDWEPCNSCAGDGYIDGYEDDPINYDPGEDVPCHLCNGEGGQHWGMNRECPTKFVTHIFKSYPSRIKLPTGKVFVAGMHY